MSEYGAYIKNCMQYCSERIPEEYFHGDDLQRNALRVEALRDKGDRCGMKPPEQWHDDAKQRGWGMWVFSGGSPSVYGHCERATCPMAEFFKRTAPKKAWRENGGTHE